MPDLDLLNEFWKRSEQEQAFRPYVANLRKCRPFSLEPDVAETIGKLSLAADGKKMRRFVSAARLPYPVMWIEFDPKIAYGKVQPPHDLFGEPQRTGFLLHQLPNSETFLAIRISRVNDVSVPGSPLMAAVYPLVHVVSPTDKFDMDYAFRDVPGGSPEVIAAMQEFNKDGIFPIMPWCHGTGVPALPEEARKHPLHRVNGVMLEPRFSDRLLTDYAGGGPLLRAAALKYMQDSAWDQMGDLAMLISALALINEVPVRFVPFRPSGHLRAGGALRPFMVSSVVSIAVPQTRRRIKEFERTILRAADALKRKRHEVRGHWRHCDRLPGTHPERWERFEDRDGRLRWRTWIANHARGDAGEGFVQQTYEVIKGRGVIAA